ncbi:MFS transporter [Actinomadura rayongensis]|uniref:DHA2 family efflux MFS transporter permease subunit n=1 Tax=Actinomadura rayongensis TaxID=1429076 RepID=A0A6I4W930_9ACTN|nr:MFS transporter [Actinomadura rayongensis]MXQ66061.1 DHA2 family efflux MFS transporter permease subunit [Actinomadura rayongensis]
MTRWRGNPWAILITLSLGFFMTLLDLTIVNIAIPSMTDKLHASLDEILWVTNAYTLVLAVLLITAGRLGDLLGKKNLFVAGVALFTLASLACGISQDPTQLIVARAVQGLGAAMLMPQTMSLIIATFPPEKRGAALGVWGGVAGISTIAGPTIGGLLVSALDWRWIFFVNLPIGILVLVMALPILPAHIKGARHRFDITGVVLASATLFCLVFGLTEGQKYNWAAWIWALIGASVVLLALFLVQQKMRQDRDPLMPFVLFADRNFSILSAIGAIVSIGMLGIFLPLTFYFQSAQGHSALEAGLIMAPSSIVSMFLAPLAGRLSDRVGGRFILLGGLTLYGLGMLWVVLIAKTDTSWVAFMPPFVLAGIGIGGVFAPMATEATRNVPPMLAGAASGVNNTIRQIGSVVGGAAVGALLQNQLASSLRDEAVKRSAELPPQYRGQFVQGFANAGKGGLEVGTSQQTTAPPPGVPQAVAHKLQELGGQVFTHGLVDAMKPTMLMPILLIFVGAAACLGVKRYRAPEQQAAQSPEPASHKG